jgi:pantetheine-phosphate adenylyltransferase
VVLAVYPGSFDPITYGHLDVIERARPFCDRLIVAVVDDPLRRPLFPVSERVRMIQEIFLGSEGIEVCKFQGLLVDFCRQRGASVVIRGLRAVSDFEHELQMALVNKRLNPDLETIFMMTAERHLFLSSSLVKEIARLGGRLDEFVPDGVAQRLREKYERMADKKGCMR